jgi:hypothetical protein
VHKLEPGHLLTVTPGRAPVIEPYWDLKFEPDYGRDEGYFVDRVRELLDESVRLHMVSDVPVGAFLSGGIDSSAIVATASALTAEPLKTFSIGFSERDYNELEHARVVARRFQTDHHELTLGPDALGPIGGPRLAPRRAVRRLVRHSDLHGFQAGRGKRKGRAVGGRRGRALRGLRQVPGGAAGAKPHAIAGVRAERAGQDRPDDARWDARTKLPAPYVVDGRRALPGCVLAFPARRHEEAVPARCFELLAPYEPWRAKAAYMESGDRNWLSATCRAST